MQLFLSYEKFLNEFKKQHKNQVDDSNREEIEREVSAEYNSIRRNRNNMQTYDFMYLTAAKNVAKKWGVRYQDIIKNHRPGNNLRGDVTWDQFGNVSKVK